MDKNSLSHTKWECKYHLVFGRRKYTVGFITVGTTKDVSMI